MGVGLCKKPKDLSASDREERGHGKGVGVYATLHKSDTERPENPFFFLFSSEERRHFVLFRRCLYKQKPEAGERLPRYRAEVLQRFRVGVPVHNVLT